MKKRMVRRFGALAGTAALAVLGLASPGVATVVSSAAPLPAPGNHALAATVQGGVDNTYNWAGYAVHNMTPTQVEASWTVPTATGSAANAGSAQWAGIGLGSSSSYPLYQAGTEADPDGNYTLWTEVVPQQATEQFAVYVSPGDVVSVHIIITSTGASFHLRDDTTGYDSYANTFTGTHTSDGHAEWIDERPTVGSDHLLPEYAHQNVTFKSAEAYSAATGWVSVGSADNYQFNMADCETDELLGSPGAISPSSQFTVVWSAAGNVESC